MAAQDWNIPGQNASGARHGKQQKKIRVTALFAPGGKSERQRAQAKAIFRPIKPEGPNTFSTP